MYDFVNKLLPESYSNTWITNAVARNVGNNDNRILRDDHLLHVPFIRLEHYLKFPLSDFPRSWNNFNNAVTANSRGTFKCLLKEYFLEKLSNVPVCQRLLCPACHFGQVNPLN
jgi:hypothetical protein